VTSALEAWRPAHGLVLRPRIRKHYASQTRRPSSTSCDCPTVIGGRAVGQRGDCESRRRPGRLKRRRFRIPNRGASVPISVILARSARGEATSVRRPLGVHLSSEISSCSRSGCSSRRRSWSRALLLAILGSLLAAEDLAWNEPTHREHSCRDIRRRRGLATSQSSERTVCAAASTGPASRVIGIASISAARTPANAAADAVAKVDASGERRAKKRRAHHHQLRRA